MPPTSSPRRRRRLHIAPVLAVVLALSALAAWPAAGGWPPVQGWPVVQGSVAAATGCGGGDYAQGIDVSKYQGDIDWAAVAASGIEFGMARIADGLTFPDATFQRNYAGMRANGITPGSYLFFEPRQDPVAQANAIVAALTTAGFRIGDLPPAIDVEVTGSQPPATVAANVRTAATAIQSALGVTPFIYASPGVWNRIVASTAFEDLPLWVAHWLVACPRLPGGWSEWSLWQYASTGVVPGISTPVDLNQATGASLPVYNGAPVFPGMTELTRYALGPITVTYPIRAVGPKGAPITPICTPATGSTFLLGTWTVRCTATSVYGATTRSFRLTVQLAAAPAFDSSFPADIGVIAAGPGGTPVTYGSVAAIDYARARLPASCSPASGALFPPGRTRVTCSATDSFGRTVARSFEVSVGYQFAGLLPPIADPVTATSPASTFVAGDTVPVRFALTYADGTPVADEEAAALVADCGASAWLAPVEGLVVRPDGSLAAAHSILGCAGYDVVTRQLAADLSTAGAPPGDYTVLVAVNDREGDRLATHLAAVIIR